MAMRSLSFVLLCLVLAQIFLLQAMADEPVAPEASPSVTNAHDTAPSRDSDSKIAEQPVSSSVESSSEGADESGSAEAPVARRLGKHKSDKSVAGGEVIIGGLVTAIFAAVFCYIRVTRKRGGVY